MNKLYYGSEEIIFPLYSRMANKHTNYLQMARLQYYEYNDIPVGLNFGVLLKAFSLDSWKAVV